MLLFGHSAETSIAQEGLLHPNGEKASLASHDSSEVAHAYTWSFYPYAGNGCAIWCMISSQALSEPFAVSMVVQESKSGWIGQIIIGG